jgi:hypothetical protein
LVAARPATREVAGRLMPYYDNPAGRLHDLLARLAEQHSGGSVLNAWAAVLEVEQADVAVRLGRVAELVRQIQEAVDQADEDALRAPVQRYRAAWARPIFPEDQPFNAELKKVLPDAASMEALNLVSAQLHSIAPEGKVPEEGELDRLKSELRELIDGVQAASDVPPEVKHLFISRLRAVEQAIEHLEVGGPSAIRQAMEAVIGSVVYTEDPATVAKSQTFRNVMATLLIIWSVFSAGPEIQQSIEAWHEVVPALVPGSDHPPQEANNK